MIGSLFLYVIQDSIVKGLPSEITTIEVIFFRSIFSLQQTPDQRWVAHRLYLTSGLLDKPHPHDKEYLHKENRFPECF